MKSMMKLSRLCVLLLAAAVTVQCVATAVDSQTSAEPAATDSYLHRSRVELKARLVEYKDLHRQAKEHKKHVHTLRQQRNTARDQRDALKTQLHHARNKRTKASSTLKSAESALLAYESGDARAKLHALNSKLTPLHAIKHSKERERRSIEKSLSTVKADFPDADTFARLTKLKNAIDQWFKEYNEVKQQRDAARDEYHKQLTVLRNAVSDARMALQDAHAHVVSFKAAFEDAQTKLEHANRRLHRAKLTQRIMDGKAESALDAVRHAGQLVKQNLDARVRLLADDVKDVQHLANKRLAHLKSREKRHARLQSRVKELRERADRLTAAIDKARNKLALSTALAHAQRNLKEAQNREAALATKVGQAKAELSSFTATMSVAMPAPPPADFL